MFKTISVIVFYLLPMPSAWSKKNFLHQKGPAQKFEKKLTNRDKSSNNRAKKEDTEEYTVLPYRVEKPLMLIYKKLLLRPCKIYKIKLLLSSLLTSTYLTAVAERNKNRGDHTTGGPVAERQKNHRPGFTGR